MINSSISFVLIKVKVKVLATHNGQSPRNTPVKKPPWVRQCGGGGEEAANFVRKRIPHFLSNIQF